MPKRKRTATRSTPASLAADEERPFRDAIRADLDNDTPRLIFADWLEERGDPRGEFIRVQCELARLDAYDPARPGLKQREAALLEQHKAEWLAALPPIVHYGDVSPAGYVERLFTRGFVSDASLASVEMFPRVAPALFAETLVHRLSIRSGNATALVGETALSQVTDLRFSGVSNPAAILTSQHLGELRGLCLDRSMAHIEPHLPAPPRLERLELAGNLLGDTGVHRLTRWPGLGRLKSLNLADNQLTAYGVRDLLQSPARSLEDLELAGNDLGRDTDTSLSGALFARTLKSLNLSRTELDRFDAGVHSLESLEVLTLRHCRLNPNAAVAFAAAAPTTLRVLNLDFNQIGDVGVQALAQTPRLANLRELSLNSADVGDAGGHALASSKTLANLRLLVCRHGGAVSKALRQRFSQVY